MLGSFILAELLPWRMGRGRTCQTHIIYISTHCRSYFASGRNYKFLNCGPISKMIASFVLALVYGATSNIVRTAGFLKIIIYMDVADHIMVVCTLLALPLVRPQSRIDLRGKCSVSDRG
jgi:hypothetical protein